MIIEFRAKNFRSIQEEIFLSFQANSSKVKEQNYFEAITESGTERLTHSLAIFGANASGKSNVIAALGALLYLVNRSYQHAIGAKIPCYEPFLFDVATAKSDVEFTLQFICEGKKYKLDVAYNGRHISREVLSYYATRKETILYNREADHTDMHKVVFGRSLRADGARKEVLPNQLYLSRFNTEAHIQLSPLCKYFSDITVRVSSNHDLLRYLNRKTAEEIVLGGAILLKRLKKLIAISDIPIQDIHIKESREEDFSFPEHFPDALKNEIISENRWHIAFTHQQYAGEEVREVPLPLDEESLGTQVLFGLGARILQTLEKGGVLVYDELDNSLHYRLSKLLVRLFNHKLSNPHHAQLIFTTHEVSIIDREMLRSDQIWFVEKNKRGASELFSAQDFEGIREDIPFDKWYQSGRFGGQPQIGDIEAIFEDQGIDVDDDAKIKEA